MAINLQAGFLSILAAPIFGYFFGSLSSDQFAIEYEAADVQASCDALLACAPYDRSAPRPNIVLIMADDLGKHDISLYGGQLIQTPNIDAIGKRGVTFTEGYVSSSVCSPSRAGLITGRYQQRFGYQFQKFERYLSSRLQYFVFRYFINSGPWKPLYMKEVPRKEDVKRQGLPPTEITLAELLQEAGYRTGMFGKWHLGEAEFNLPCTRGFEDFYGFYGSHSLYAYEDADWVHNQYIDGDWTDPFLWKDQREGDNAIYDQCQEIEEQAYLTDRFADEAIAWMDRHKADPFFCYIPFSAPHTPLQVPADELKEVSHIADPVRQTYNAMILHLDEAVGRITDFLDSSGLADNTLIFFLSDNGGAVYTLTTDNGPLKGGKITPYEGGLNVPFLASWPGVLPEGKTFTRPVISLDIFPTAAAAAGIQLPADRVYDGIDLAEVFAESVPGTVHDTLFWWSGFNRVVRFGDWKLILDEKYDRTLLYDLGKDKSERNNLAEAHPELVEQLRTMHYDWSKDHDEPLWPTMIEYSMIIDGKRQFFSE